VKEYRLVVAALALAIFPAAAGIGSAMFALGVQ
jgi:hypothetical protein